MFVAEIHFNGQSPEKSCVNMRDAMYYRLKKWLAKGSLPDDPELLKELANQELTDDANNRVKLAQKKVIRARINRSPNDSDAVALTFADEVADFVESPEEIKTRAMAELMAASGITLQDAQYDPLNYMDPLTGDSNPDDDYNYFT